MIGYLIVGFSSLVFLGCAVAPFIQEEISK